MIHRFKTKLENGCYLVDYHDDNLRLQKTVYYDSLNRVSRMDGPAVIFYDRSFQINEIVSQYAYEGILFDRMRYKDWLKSVEIDIDNMSEYDKVLSHMFLKGLTNENSVS